MCVAVWLHNECSCHDENQYKTNKTTLLPNPYNLIQAYKQIYSYIAIAMHACNNFINSRGSSSGVSGVSEVSGNPLPLTQL